jgi:hypothetical protein
MTFPFLIMDEYPYSMNEFTLYDAGDGTLNLNKYQYPYSLTDESGNKWTVSAVPESNSIRVEKQTTMSESKNHLWKYNEDKILKDIEDYVTSTYGSHYCGHNEDYNDIQTIDLMAAKDLAPGFCQANILKYGSRYGDKDGRNKRDLMKVIHYAMLLLHFDGHYSRKDNGLTEFR